MPQLTLQSATGMLTLLRAREISPLELAEAHIRQIERLNPILNAVSEFDPERVRHEAAALTRSGNQAGALFGLPLTIKSTIAVAGYRSETGSLLHHGNTSAEDAVIVARARRAGAVILGTTNCPEFLMAYETDNRLTGRTNNPWNTARTAGGSSGGESAAIAAGLSPAGFGSDGGGSVREPASFTGICALKPTPGRIPSIGHIPANTGPFALLGVVGPMARTIEDVTLLFQTLSGAFDADPAGAPVPYREPTLAGLRQIPIGFFADDGIIPVTPDNRRAVAQAVAALRAEGFRVEPFRPPSLEAARRLWWTLFVRGGAAYLEPITAGREHLLSPTFLDFLEIAHQDPPLTATEVLAAWAECDLLRARLLEEMRAFPILLSPVCAVPAFRHGERHYHIPDGGDGSDGSDSSKSVSYLDAMRFTQWINLLGAPAAVVPVTSTPENLPIGVQIAGRPWHDEEVLAIAGILDRTFGYRPPPLASIP